MRAVVTRSSRSSGASGSASSARANASSASSQEPSAYAARACSRSGLTVVMRLSSCNRFRRGLDRRALQRAGAAGAAKRRRRSRSMLVIAGREQPIRYATPRGDPFSGHERCSRTVTHQPGSVPVPLWHRFVLTWHHICATMALWICVRMSRAFTGSWRPRPRPAARTPARWRNGSPHRSRRPFGSALQDALAAAVEEITCELAPGSVELRLRGRDPEFVVRLPPVDPADSADEEPTPPSAALACGGRA